MQVLRISLAKTNSTEWNEDATTLFEEPACVCVVRESEVDRVRKSGLELGAPMTKAANSGLAQYVVFDRDTRKEPVQVVFARYSSGGRLAQGIRDLLTTAKRHEYLPHVLVGASEKAFDDLAAQHGAKPKTPRPHGFFARLETVHVPDEVREKFKGGSKEAKRARALIVCAAKTDATVLLQGETGTGKEIAARLIHERSERASEPFMAINCAAITRSLFETELFGYEPVFTGAQPEGRPGVWEHAHKGTLFLDEVGEIALEAQAKVLRAIQEKAVRRVGGLLEYSVDVRIIAASCRDLGDMVASGTFRPDLYHRLLGFLIRTPALDADPETLPHMIQELWRGITGNTNARLHKKVVNLLASRRWPGNFRDLKNFLHRLHLNAPDGITERDVLELMEYYGPPVRAGRQRDPEDSAAAMHRLDCLRHFRRTAEVLRALHSLVQPVARQQAVLPEEADWTLGHSFSELEFLLARPLDFHSEETFNAVLAAKDALDVFRTRLTDPADNAHDHCRNRLLPAIDNALSALFAETERMERP